ARGVMDHDFLRPAVAVARLHGPAQRIRATAMARHVAADLHLDRGRRCELEGWKEARDALQTVERHLDAVREDLEGLDREVAVHFLNFAKPVDDRRLHGVCLISVLESKTAQTYAGRASMSTAGPSDFPFRP